MYVNLIIKRFTDKLTTSQLIESNMRHVFLEKSCTKYCGEISPRLFFKRSKLNISLDQQPEVSYSLFLFYAQVQKHQNILKLRC